MKQYTKGPWYIKGSNPPYIYANDAMEIICQCDSIKEMTKDQEMANARLIAAAPELLEALEEMVNKYCYLRPKGYGTEGLKAMALIERIKGK